MSAGVSGSSCEGTRSEQGKGRKGNGLKGKGRGSSSVPPCTTLHTHGRGVQCQKSKHVCRVHVMCRADCVHNVQFYFLFAM